MMSTSTDPPSASRTGTTSTPSNSPPAPALTISSFSVNLGFVHDARQVRGTKVEGDCRCEGLVAESREEQQIEVRTVLKDIRPLAFRGYITAFMVAQSTSVSST